MLREPSDEVERASAELNLHRAHALMTEALGMLDATPVATDCDAHLDMAVDLLGKTIEEVKAGGAIFRG